MKYTNVQFVGYSVSTHPKTYGDGSLYRFYPGLADDQADLEARLALLETAFLLAGNFFSENEDVYRVFVAPEFFFRGACGAYAGPGLETFLESALDGILARSGGEVDLAVWGTGLFADQALNIENPSIRSKLLLGDDFLAVYHACKELRDKIGVDTPGLTGILFHLDELEDMGNGQAGQELDPLASVLRELLASCDASAEIFIRNVSQISCASGRRLLVQKRHKSKVDFVLNHYLGAGREKSNAGAFLQTLVRYPEIPAVAGELKRKDSDPYCVFTEGGLKIGVEICLDHIRRRLVRSGTQVDLQIVPSCGVEVTPGAVSARPGGYVFNCDGDYLLDNARNGVGSHTQLFCVEEAPGAGENAVLGRRIEAERTVRVEHSAGGLFAHGAGELHIYAPQPLNCRS